MLLFIYSLVRRQFFGPQLLQCLLSLLLGVSFLFLIKSVLRLQHVFMKAGLTRLQRSFHGSRLAYILLDDSGFR